MIWSANQFYVTANKVGNCVAVTADQFFRPSANTDAFVLTEITNYKTISVLKSWHKNVTDLKDTVSLKAN